MFLKLHNTQVELFRKAYN